MLYRTLTARTPVARTGSIGSVVPERGIPVKAAKAMWRAGAPWPGAHSGSGMPYSGGSTDRQDARPGAETAEPNRRTH